MNKGPLEDRIAIRELIEEFAAAVMRIDAERWSKTWAIDGAWKLPSLPEDVVGRDQIKAMFADKLDYVDHMSMIAFPAELTVEGDRASGKAYCRELIFANDGGQRVLIGCFHDDYVKQDGQWLFQRREYEILGVPHLS